MTNTRAEALSCDMENSAVWPGGNRCEAKKRPKTAA